MLLPTVCVKWVSPGHSGLKGLGFYPWRAKVLESLIKVLFLLLLSRKIAAIPIPLVE